MKVRFIDQHFVLSVVDVVFVAKTYGAYKLLYWPKKHESLKKTVIAVKKAPKYESKILWGMHKLEVHT